VTRGRRLVVIVGSRRALGRAVRNATVRGRYSLLAERLRMPESAGPDRG
jgi:exodeoxyribonuclease V alpha subunit